ncbi:hypothetical protein E4U23_003123, partial [Claviceps purpurea]
EKVIRIGTIAAYSKYLDKIEKLSMDIADNGNRSQHVDDIALAHKQFLRLGAYGFNK